MKFLVFAALVAVTVSETTYPEAYPAVYPEASPAAYPDANLAAYPAVYEKSTYDYAPQPYSYSYAVKDEASYNDYSHSESRDGNVVTGSYSVALPDGRTQVVTYKADSYGYVADVKYIGEAKYPEYSPVAYTPSYETPVYTAENPEPAY
ncbi:cuticle protein-like [Daphnia carinata]|uniref:cuticle protein-like n=1 Tax=Daphnia carinata TaxID=120202 RepID=UPI00257CE8B3|nr:cuticle protein-like [Daphnia carinata]